MTKRTPSFLAALLAVCLLASCDSSPVTPTETDGTTASAAVSDTQGVTETETAAIPEPVEVESPGVFTDAEPAQTFVSGDQTLRLNIIGNDLVVEELSTSKAGNVIAENSVYDLPKYLKIDGEEVAINWTYTGCQTWEGKTDNGVSTNGVVYTFTDAEKQLALRVSCEIRPDVDGPFEFSAQLDNQSSAEVRLVPRDFASFTFAASPTGTTTAVSIGREDIVAEGVPTTLTNYQKHTIGIRYYTVSTTEVIAKLTTRTNEKDQFPIFYFDRGDNSGYMVALEWTQGRVHHVENEDGNVYVTVNIDKGVVSLFSTIVDANTTFEIPSVYLSAYDGDMEDGSNLLKSWYFDCKTPSNLRENPNEPLTQVEVQMTLDEAVACGVESIKWCYGWFTTHNFTSITTGEAVYDYEGSWVLRNSGYVSLLNRHGVSTMGEYGQLAKAKGLNWTVYVLLHNTLSPEEVPTDAYGELNSITHPDWFDEDDSDSPADLGNEECVAYLKTALYDFFTENNIGTWRSDFELILYESDEQNRHDAKGTDVMYWCTVGFTEILEHLIDNIDGFRYESCNCGGGLKSLYLGQYATVFNCDDTQEYLSLRASFYDSSYVIHPAQLQIPCNPDTMNTDLKWFFPKIENPTDDADYDFHDAVADMGYRTTLLGSPMWNSWTGTVLKDYYTEYAALYKEKIRPLVRDGELYHIARPDGTNWDGVMYTDPDSANEIKGAIFLFKPSAEVEDTYHLNLRGLDENTTYDLTFYDRPEQNLTATGKELMENGIDVEIKYIGSEIIFITESK